MCEASCALWDSSPRSGPNDSPTAAIRPQLFKCCWHLWAGTTCAKTGPFALEVRVDVRVVPCEK